MKKNILLIMLAGLVCLAGLFAGVNRARAVTGRSVVKVNRILPLQSKVQPFCKFTFIDHHGHGVKLQTSVTHASAKSLTFIFETGEKLIIDFMAPLRPGHFVAESARSKDTRIIFSHSPGGPPSPMVGAVVISSVKPIVGSFGHLVSDDEEHITLISGTFSL